MSTGLNNCGGWGRPVHWCCPSTEATTPPLTLCYYSPQAQCHCEAVSAHNSCTQNQWLLISHWPCNPNTDVTTRLCPASWGGGGGRTDHPQRFETHSSAGGHAIRGKEILKLPQGPEPSLKDQLEWVSLNGLHWANELLHLESNPELKLISTQPEINQENKQAALDSH